MIGINLSYHKLDLSYTVMMLEWLSNNLIRKYIIFSRSKTELPGPLILCNRAIEGQSGSWFLGVIVDENLSWARHIQTVQRKLSRYISHIGIIYAFKIRLPLKCMLYIQSIGDAGVWIPDNFSLFNIPGLSKATLNQTECKLYNLERHPSI